MLRPTYTVPPRPNNKKSTPAKNTKRQPLRSKAITPTNTRTNTAILKNDNSGTRGIPRSAPSKPLSDNKNAAKIHGNLKQKSPWYGSIMNPAQGAGVKIPDDVAVETGTLQCSYETSFTTNVNGFGAIRSICLHPNAIAGNGENIQKATVGSSGSAINWDQATALPTNTALRAYSHAVRVVSAGLYVQSEASLSSAQGEMILGYDIFNYSNSAIIDQFRNSFGAAIMPLNVCKPMKALWTPVSLGLQTYNAFYSPNSLAYGPGPSECPRWSLFAIVNGCVPDQVFRCRLVVNYEFVPFENSIDILSALPSPVDATEVDLVETWVADTPPVRPSTNTEMSTAPGAGVMDKTGAQDAGPTGFGMFFDVLKELVPLAIELI